VRRAIRQDLIPALERLRDALQAKAREFDDIVKSGRTHLMDATPVRLGQEFGGYAAQIEHGHPPPARGRERDLAELPLGGTAVGTGINTHAGLRRAGDRAHQRARASSSARRRTTSSGRARGHHRLRARRAEHAGRLADEDRQRHPLAGQRPARRAGEITLPAIQPGSSIMPGKVNPVIPEAVTMVAAQVMGNHTTITVGGQGSWFELNVMMPVMAHALLQSVTLLDRVARARGEVRRRHHANEDRCRELLEGNLSLATALAPKIGYDEAAAIAKQAFKKGRPPGRWPGAAVLPRPSWMRCWTRGP
jgi:fumarate hydratase, class II